MRRGSPEPPRAKVHLRGSSARLPASSGGRSEMATFILVHGAWHGGWCWERLAPLLTAAGHRVLAPDLPGMGADRRQLGDDPLGEWAEAAMPCDTVAVLEADHSPFYSAA